LLVGACVLSPRRARTQQRSIGFLSAGSTDAHAPFVAAFRAGIADFGFVEGRNLTIEFRWAEGHYDRLAELATDLVRSRVEVIATSGGDIVAAAAKDCDDVAGRENRDACACHRIEPAANDLQPSPVSVRSAATPDGNCHLKSPIAVAAPSTDRNRPAWL